MALGSNKQKPPRVGALDRRLSPAPTRTRSDRHERAAAEDYGGRVKGGSGASMYSKGDVEIKRLDLLMECKSTGAASYRIEMATLAKITKEAIGEGKDPCLEIEIGGGEPDLLTEKRWVMIPSTVFRRMVGDGNI